MHATTAAVTKASATNTEIISVLTVPGLLAATAACRLFDADVSLNNPAAANITWISLVLGLGPTDFGHGLGRASVGLGLLNGTALGSSL